MKIGAPKNNIPIHVVLKIRKLISLQHISLCKSYSQTSYVYIQQKTVLCNLNEVGPHI